MAASKRPPLLLLLILLSLWAVSADAQGLIPVPKQLTPDLGAYYINTLGPSVRYYGLLTQRNNIGTNAYAINNALPAGVDPITAAGIVSPIRGRYYSNGIGGKVQVDMFLKLFRCEDQACAIMDRVLLAGVSPGQQGPADALTVVKGHVGGSSWLINANQRTANNLLANAQERVYRDPTSGTRLYYKVNLAPPPCDPVYPNTAWASIGEFSNIPQFACINGGGATFLFATQTPNGQAALIQDIVPPEECDGSLGVILGTGGPSIAKVVEEPGAVPIVILLVLPGISVGPCFGLYDDNSLVFEMAALMGQTSFYSATRSKDMQSILDAGAELGFNATCGFQSFSTLYGPYVIGQSNSIYDTVQNQTTLSMLMKYNDTGACMALVGNSYSMGEHDTTEDACADIFFGQPSQAREAVLSYNILPPTTSQAMANVLLPNMTSHCVKNYAMSVQNILPQVSIDFEAKKNFLIGSNEVKNALDNVAANAASILAVEVALASAGIIVARTIGRLGVYRKRQISSPMARTIALFLTALGITLFNIPNFALVSKSLHTHRSEKAYTQVGLQQYAPGNFSTIIYAESYQFVTVQGSSATAVIGLVLYFLTLIGSLYLTWSEFTEMIHRRREVTRRLGHDALEQDKRLLIDWRGTDSLLHDRLYPKAVTEMGQAAEIELMRRQVLAREAASWGIKQAPADAV